MNAVIALLLISSVANSDSDTENHAIYTWNANTLLLATQTLETMNTPAAQLETAMLHYQRSIVLFSEGERAAAGRAERQCGTTLNHQSANAVWKSRFHALQANCWGMAIAIDPMTGMALGPRIASEMQQAKSGHPEDAFVLLMLGLQNLHTPEQWGGNKKLALTSLKKAITRIAHDDQLAWLQAYTQALLLEAKVANAELEQAKHDFQSMSFRGAAAEYIKYTARRTGIVE